MQITPEFAAKLIREEADANMAGQSLYGDVGLPEVGGSLEDYLTRLHFAGQSQKAYDLATMEGIDGREFEAMVQGINDATRPRNKTKDVLGTLWDMYVHNPLLNVAIGGSIAGALGGGASATGGGGGAIPAGLEVGPNGLLTGSAAAAGGGVGTLSGAVPAVGAAPGIGAGTASAAAGLTAGPNGLPTADIAAGGGPALVSNAAGAAGGMNWLDWANIGSTVLGIAGAGQAADAQVASSQAAVDEAKRQYDTTRGDFAPTIKLGQQSAETLGALQRGDMSSFFTSPDYQFNLAEGQKAIDRSLAARGKSLSGQGVKEGVRYASGMASNQYGSFVDRLLAAAGLGTTGAAASANAGANSAATVGNAYQNAGAARASGYANQYGALQGGIANRLFKQYLGG